METVKTQSVSKLRILFMSDSLINLIQNEYIADAV
jgi:hypothetical protein